MAIHLSFCGVHESFYEGSFCQTCESGAKPLTVDLILAKVELIKLLRRLG